MIDFAYEDLETEAARERKENETFAAQEAEVLLAKEKREFETEAVKERGENERYEAGLEEYEAECAADEGHGEPTPTKAQRVKARAEMILGCMRDDGTSTYLDRVIYHLLADLADLAEAIDER